MNDVDGPESPATRLDRLERQFAEIQRLAHSGSWEWDIASNVVTWSDELYRIYGVEPKEFEATYDAFISRIHPDDQEMVNQTVQRAYGECSSYAFDHRLVRRDGAVRWLHGRGEVIADEQGSPRRLYGIAVDITERKRSEEFLRDFIANASHELRTPASAISQAAHLLTDGRLSAADRDATVTALARQADRLRDLTTNLLDLAALERGPDFVILRPVALGAQVRAAAQAAPTIDGLQIDIADDLEVMADPTQLERVFVNLLANAQAYGGPSVSVCARSIGDEVLTEVRDDGPGVPEAFHQSLFAPFATGRVAGGGSGLGLAIVHQLMAAFGGTIAYRPGDGGGALFTLRFARARR